MRQLFTTMIVAVVATALCATAIAEPMPIVNLTFDAGDLTNTGTGGPASGTLFHDYGTGGNASFITGGAGVNGDHGLAFDVDKYGESAKLEYTMPDDGTLTFWARTNSFYNYVAYLDNSLNNAAWEIWNNGGGAGAFRISTSARRNFEVYPHTSILTPGPNDPWIHYAMTWDRTATSVEIKVYLDGAYENVDTGTWQNPGTTIAIGGGLNDGNKAGDVTFDDFRIYDTVLTAEEIAVVYNAVPEPSSIALLISAMAILFIRRKKA